MPIPAVDNAHVTEGAALTTSRYASAKAVQGIIKSLMLRFQQVENDYWTFINGVQIANHPMAGGPWSILDQIGGIVGLPRNGLADADYVPALKIQIRINRSNGLAEDIIQITGLVVSGAIYNEWWPAAFEVGVFNTTGSIALALATYLGEARSAGTAGTVRYTLTGNNSVIVWGDTYGAPGTGFGSSYSTKPYCWSALEAL